ncbi:hypothetical protein PCC7424_3553 [Gloeothece citriformis PCC 7424]|uniref:Uncharacterized protein n=1 Tax=Gloeothece citriformis (strain PCC 7424) TaxID=65393 RepID=B7KGL6_GLOC7|nr:hypothetical protein [Gloeothece citriformis]ACK71943.1 hypothetical protein PCC7424_3553 [Gloeothece citriformis PCC 7424]
MAFFSRLYFLPLVIGIVTCTALPSTADELKPIPVEDVETLSPATGTLDDLSELPSKTIVDWSWNNESEDISQFYQIDSQSYQSTPSVDFLEEQNDWKKATHGDQEAPSASIPLTKF